MLHRFVGENDAVVRRTVKEPCLIDFGVPADEVLAALPLLAGLRELANIDDTELAIA